MTRNWRLFASLGVLATVLYTADVSPALNAACMLVVAAGSVGACLTGPRRHGAEPRTAWRLLGGAVLGCLAGVLIRPAVQDLPGLWPLLADAASISGYAMLCAFLVIMLRRRQGIDPHAVLDGLLVCVAGALVVGLLLAAPAAAISDRPEPVSFVAGLYPLFDIVRLAGESRARLVALYTIEVPASRSIDDVSPGDHPSIGVTAVRSPVYAWHDPKTLDPDGLYAFQDHGVQRFTYELAPGFDLPERGRGKEMSVSAEEELGTVGGMPAPGSSGTS